MRILIAPDKFKGSLGARDVAQCIATGVRDALPDAAIDLMPVADGGEGTAEVIGQARSGEWITCDAYDAIGRPMQARYVWLESSATAVMEISEAVGLWRISENERDPTRANTGGVGEMLLDAARRGAREIVVGLGGSATNDGGFGLARTLGYRFLDLNGVELTNEPAELVRLARIERDAFAGDDDVGALLRSAQARLVERIAKISPEGGPVPSTRRFAPTFAKAAAGMKAPLHLIVAIDVRNPLLGAHGATRTFGPQKGADPEQIEILEKALTRLADIVARDLGVDCRDSPGSGAAGGLGFGLMSFCGATVRSGFDVVSEMLDLDAAVRRADVVITGEGSLDDQTLEGKAPAGVARLARRFGKRIFAIVGCAVESSALQNTFDAVFPLAKPSVTREEAISRARELLQERGRELGRMLADVV